MEKVRITLTNPDGSTDTPTGGLTPYAARLLLGALANDRQTPAPPAGDFDEHLESIAQLTRLITHLEAGRDEQVAAADREGGPYADRSALGIAAGMARSRLYRVLGRFGRPTNRRAPAVDTDPQGTATTWQDKGAPGGDGPTPDGE